MEEHVIDFRDIEWKTPAPGIRYKASVHEDKKLRLVEFTDQVNFDHWCTLAHIGYVLEGTMTLDFEHKKVDFHPGDGIFIPEGTKHKPLVDKGERAVVVFVEKA
jgi:mannose-6-phosphate isomerase-like protein (cupin superfamily)